VKQKTENSRREFLKTGLSGLAGVIVMPTIVPGRVLGSNAPSNRIYIGTIGAELIAVCDVDAKRAREGKTWVEKYYQENRNQQFRGVRVYSDFRELLANPEIDAVLISTPDHWHAIPAMAAARAGKDIYLQKPASLTIREGRELSDVIHQTGRILQMGSQQRSLSPWPQFKRACELVRNGRIGEVHTVKIGLPGDPAGNEEPEMKVPPNLNYDMWLGPTPFVYYTEKRVHPQHGYSRPGWLRCEQFGSGMITGWGAHHIDTAHWGMGTEYTGPVEVTASAEFPEKGLWDVHGDFNVEAGYENGVTMLISGSYPNGVRFIGSEGWIFVSRGDIPVTDSDPLGSAKNTEALNASDPKILSSEISPEEIHLYESQEQHGNWLECIRTRKQPVAPVEVGHRSCTACLVSHIAMKLPRTLYWDPVNERFKNDDEANSMLSRPRRLAWR
jgi:myo-inositol 2-dehydrogenase/D-chiro-inositol 1-dehydrogenase